LKQGQAITMTKTTIHLVAGIKNITLIVFYTSTHCWQFRLISAGGAVFGERKLYYSALRLKKLDGIGLWIEDNWETHWW